MRYLVLHPGFAADEYHLNVDMGIIPIRISQRGWQVFVASDRPANFPNPITNIEFDGAHLGSLRCLRNWARKVDVLHLFHFTWRSIVRAIAFKMLNPAGVVYIKLDTDEPTMRAMEDGASWFLQRLWYRMGLSSVDVFSAESRDLQSRFENLTRKCGRHREVIWIPTCGFDIERVLDQVESNGLTDTSHHEEPSGILYVGRVGAPPKRTDVLLEAFRIFREERGRDGSLDLVGPLYPQATPMLSDWARRASASTKSALHVLGPDYDRDSLIRRYLGAKVFVICSASEAGPNAFVEAASCGCVLVGTPVGQIPDVLASGAKGWMVNIGNVDHLADALGAALAARDSWEQRIARMRAFSKYYSWDAAISRLMDALERHVANQTP